MVLPELLLIGGRKMPDREVSVVSFHAAFASGAISV